MSATPPPVTAYLALGANLGNARQAVQDAVDAIAALPTTQVLVQSPLYRTAPIDSSGPDYINAVVQVHTRLAPYDLLQGVQAIELAAGRERPYRNAPRTLDIDILLYGDVHLHDAELTLPHPRMWHRAFVLVPLADVAPGLVSAAQLEAVADQPIERLD